MKYPTTSSIIIILLSFLLLSAGFISAHSAGVGSQNSNEPEQNSSAVRNSETRADYAFSIQFQVESKLFQPGVKDRVVLEIENLGTLTDTYTLEIKQVPTNWTVIFSSNAQTIMETTINTGESDAHDLLITPPESGEAYITVWATSQNSSLTNNTGIDLKVKQPPIKMTFDARDKNAAPGETASFIVNITNVRDVIVKVTISLTGSGIEFFETSKETEWTYSVNPSRIFEVNATSTDFISIDIHAPIDTVSDVKGSFNVEAQTKIDTVEDMTVSEEISVRIMKKEQVLAIPDPMKSGGKPGDVLEFDVLMINNGTNDLENVVLFKGELPPGWEFIYNASLKYKLDRDEEKTIKIQVRIPDSAQVGTFGLPMFIYKEHESIHIGNFSVDVEVLQMAGVQLALIDPPVEPDTTIVRYNVSWMKESTVQFLLENTGNGIDTIKLNLSSVPDFWQVYFKSVEPGSGNSFSNVTADFSNILDATNIVSETSRLINTAGSSQDEIMVTLKQGMSVKITLGVNSSLQDKSGHNYNFTINALSGNGQAAHSIVLEILLIRSEVVVDSVILSKTVPRIDESVTVTVTIKNDYHITADNLTVTLVINDKKQGERKISEIPANGSSTVDFEWTPSKKGTYDFDVEISGPVITPGTELAKTREVFVEEKLDADGSDERDLGPILLVIGVMLVLAILAAVLLYFSREKIQLLKRKRKEEYNKKQNGNNGDKAKKPTFEKPGKISEGKGPGRRPRLPPPPSD